MSDCLIILNPRNIEECIESFDDLDIAKCWLTAYTEHDLQTAFNDAVAHGSFERYCVISDDCTVSTPALTAALATKGTVTTGYCNLAEGNPLVNLCEVPLRGDHPVADAYTFMRQDRVQAGPQTFKTFFAGMCLTTMSKAMWLEFPFMSFGEPPGYGSDFSLCKRLQDANVRIVANRDAWVDHVKETWNVPDQDPRKRLLFGEVSSNTRWET